MTLRDTEGDEDRPGGADAPVRAGPPGPASAEPGGSAAGQGTRPTNGVLNRAVARWSNYEGTRGTVTHRERAEPYERINKVFL
jgi:hypothetical protein